MGKALHLLCFTFLRTLISCHSCLDIFFPINELHSLGFVILANQTSSSQHVCSVKFCTGSVSATGNTVDMWFWGVQYFLQLCYIVKVRGEVQRFILQCLGDSFQATLSIVEERLLWICILCIVCIVCGFILAW